MTEQKPIPVLFVVIVFIAFSLFFLILWLIFSGYGSDLLATIQKLFTLR